MKRKTYSKFLERRRNFDALVSAYSKVLTMLEATGNLEKLTEGTEENGKKGDGHDNTERSKQ